MLKDINVRFFAYDYSIEDELVITEIEETVFKELSQIAPISYERHSVHANGVRQVCLTVECCLEGDLI